MFKKSILFFLIGLILSSVILVFINFIIDPFQVYRKSTFHKAIFMKGFYLNAGLIKTYDYDSVSIGSSMTQNFIIKELKDNLGWEKPIKLPVSGGRIEEHYTVLRSAINTGKVKNVLFGLDIFSLSRNENRLPKYLYDEVVLNDYKYLYSIDTLKRSLTYPFLHLTIPSNHPRLNYNLMFQWQHNYSEKDFSEKKVIKQFANNSINLDNNKDSNNIIKTRMLNFKKYVLELVQDNPNINFTFFYPPYSILSYKSMNNDTLNSFLDTKMKINKMLLKYPNIRIFDFQEVKEVIENLNNYKDLTHYHQKINTWMLNQINYNRYKIDNNETNFKSFKDSIKSYSYESLK
jgi:hypothetical protein